MIRFIVLSLPRSGSTWLANWLTTDTTLCLHDPFAKLRPSELTSTGIACTGAYLFPGWLNQQDCPVAVITRNYRDCDASLDAMGLPRTTQHMRHMLSLTEGRRWRYDDIWNETEARKLWAFLLPDIPFNAERYRLLKDMQVQPRTWEYDMAVLNEMTGEPSCLGA